MKIKPSKYFSDCYKKDLSMWKKQNSKKLNFDDWLDENWEDLIKEI